MQRYHATRALSLTARHPPPAHGGAQAATERRPTQLSSLQKAHSCDRRHILDAVAELASCSSIVPPYVVVRRSSYSPAPRERGCFFRRFLCRELLPSPGRHHVTASENHLPLPAFALLKRNVES